MSYHNPVQKFTYTLDALIRARYPIIWIDTHEEQRFISILNDITNNWLKSREILTWSITAGLKTLDNQIKITDINDPLTALEHIDSSPNPNIFVLEDFHRFMEDLHVVRKLRDLHTSLKETYKTIIITAPTSQIPPELKKSISILSLPLPNKDELSTIIDNIIDGIGDRPLKSSLNSTWTSNKDTLLSAGLGLTTDEFENVIARSIVESKSLDSKTIASEKQQIVKKSGTLEYITPDCTLEDIGGLNILKEWIMQRKLAFTPKAREFGLPLPKGVMFAGPPGTGKSLAAKVISIVLNMPLLRFDPSMIFSKYVGESEQKIKDMLNTAAAVAPCVLFIDEVEKMFAGAGGDGDSSGVTTRIFGEILTWQQELEDPVFTVVTSNNPSRLPPEFNRAGRFDQTFYLGIPTTEERDEIFKIHISKLKRDHRDYKTHHFAELTHGYSGAEIQNVIKDALYAAFYSGDELQDSDIELAIRNTTPLTISRPDDLKAIIEWGKTYALNASTPETSQQLSRSSSIEY